MSIHLIQQGVREGEHTLMLEADQVINYSLVDDAGDPVDIQSPAIVSLRLYPSENRFQSPSGFFDISPVEGDAGYGQVTVSDANDQNLSNQTYYAWAYYTGNVSPVIAAVLDANSVSITEHPVFTLSADHGSGASLSINVAAYNVSAIAQAGTGYVVDDILTHDDQGGSVVAADLATFRVTSVGGSGEITGVSVENDGEYDGITSADSNNNAVTGGTGTGAELNIVWTGIEGTLAVSAGGSGYTDAPDVAVANAASMAVSVTINDLERLITFNPVKLTFK